MRRGKAPSAVLSGGMLRAMPRSPRSPWGSETPLSPLTLAELDGRRCVAVAVPLPLPLPCPFPLPLPPSSIVVGVVEVGGSTTVVGGEVGASQSATGIAQEALVVTLPSGQAAVAYTVTVA